MVNHLGMAVIITHNIFIIHIANNYLHKLVCVIDYIYSTNRPGQNSLGKTFFTSFRLKSTFTNVVNSAYITILVPKITPIIGSMEGFKLHDILMPQHLFQ